MTTKGGTDEETDVLSTSTISQSDEEIHVGYTPSSAEEDETDRETDRDTDQDTDIFSSDNPSETNEHDERTKNFITSMEESVTSILRLSASFAKGKM